MLDVTGALFGLVALTVVPISVAQPIFCNGLVLLALYSHFYLKEQLGRHGASVVGCGVCLARSGLEAWHGVPCLACCVSLLSLPHEGGSGLPSDFASWERCC